MRGSGTVTYLGSAKRGDYMQTSPGRKKLQPSGVFTRGGDQKSPGMRERGTKVIKKEEGVGGTREIR